MRERLSRLRSTISGLALEGTGRTTRPWASEVQVGPQWGADPGGEGGGDTPGGVGGLGAIRQGIGVEEVPAEGQGGPGPGGDLSWTREKRDVKKSK